MNMRKLSLVLLLGLSSMLVLPIIEAGAAGFGTYFDYNRGSSSWRADNGYTTWDFDSDKKIVGLGFVFDTAVAKDKLFNYRLQLGFEAWKDESEADEELDLSGIAWTNDFGFGVLRTPNLRLWLGPELKLAYVKGTLEASPDLDMSLLNFGIGPTIGVNFNVGSTLTLAVKTGYLFEFFSALGERSPFDDITYSGTSTTVFINFTLLFRVNDTY